MNAMTIKSLPTWIDQKTSTFGTTELCTWPVGPGICRFQTTSPEFAGKLADRSGAKLVGWSVDGGYLRIFQEEIEPWRARQLVARYLKREPNRTPTNGAFSPQISPPSRSKTSGVSPEQKEAA
jgi:hypothetical protein